jgi:hypothetical protein
MPETESTPLVLGTQRSWGETTCHFGVDKPACTATATRHFMWLTDNSTSAACDEHAAYIHSRDTSATPFDEHAHGPNCGMPGAMWRFPYEDQDEGYCFVEAPDDLSAMADVEIPTEAQR